MSSNQVQIAYMVNKLKDWNQLLGGSDTKKKMAQSQFQYLQEEFLSKRYTIQKMQNQKQLQGLTTKTASHGYQIRQGIVDLQSFVGKMKQQHRKLTKKKKDTPEVLNRKQKIIQNCELLLKDIEQRQQGNTQHYMKANKVMTLTDMKAKLLEEIQENNYQIAHAGSDGKLSETNEEQDRAMKRFKEKDLEMDDALDDIINGVKGVKQKVKGINQKQDVIIEKTHQNKKKIQKTSKRIQTDNDKLKKVIQQFKPNRCCLAIVLFLLFVGLIVVAIKMFAK